MLSKMKKCITLCIVFIHALATSQAQCPTKIVDVIGDGGDYTFILSAPGQCVNFPVPSAILINGQNYIVAGCSINFGVTTVTVAFDSGTPVILANDAPITIPVGMSSCKYNSLGNPLVLPIELIEFTGTPSVSGNILAWTTVREVSSRGFQVERLVGDKTWMPLSFVKSKGAYGKYQFTDYNPLATSYYRLRQLDNDGAETFSKIVTVAAKGNNKLKAYPNPVSNVLTVETDNAGTFEIVNILGQQVITGKAAQRINVSELVQGTYILKVGTEQVKFVKQ
jgi:Secretion system C-terminal sorting domain